MFEVYPKTKRNTNPIQVLALKKNTQVLLKIIFFLSSSLSLFSWKNTHKYIHRGTLLRNPNDWTQLLFLAQSGDVCSRGCRKIPRSLKTLLLVNHIPCPWWNVHRFHIRYWRHTISPPLISRIFIWIHTLQVLISMTQNLTRPDLTSTCYFCLILGVHEQYIYRYISYLNGCTFLYSFPSITSSGDPINYAWWCING